MKDQDRKRLARKMFSQPVTRFEQIDLSKAKFVPKGMTRAYNNTRYMVMVYDNQPTSTGTAIRVMVQKHDDTRIAHHWKEMQTIKNEIFGEETVSVEYYPAQSRLEDQHNIYWMFIFPNNDLPIPI